MIFTISIFERRIQSKASMMVLLISMKSVGRLKIRPDTKQHWHPTVCIELSHMQPSAYATIFWLIRTPVQSAHNKIACERRQPKEPETIADKWISITATVTQFAAPMSILSNWEVGLAPVIGGLVAVKCKGRRKCDAIGGGKTVCLSSQFSIRASQETAKQRTWGNVGLSYRRNRFQMILFLWPLCAGRRVASKPPC